MIYLGADHAGFHLKEAIKKHLPLLNISFKDMGNFVYEQSDDFPDFALDVAKKVVRTKGKGLLFCGSAIGMVIAANKVKGVRAGHVFNSYTARQSREHDDTNIAVFSGRLTSVNLAKRLVKIWLETKFLKKEKYRRRIGKIKKIEKNRLVPHI
jgi:ribose 5-phosphate isomerase B